MYLCVCLCKDEHLHVPFRRSLRCDNVRGLSASCRLWIQKCISTVEFWSQCQQGDSVLLPTAHFLLSVVLISVTLFGSTDCFHIVIQEEVVFK